MKEYLQFSLSRQSYGIENCYIHGVRSYGQLSHLREQSQFHPHYKGRASIEGMHMPIIDLRVIAGEVNPDFVISTLALILNIDGGFIIVVVDSVNGLLEVQSEDVVTVEGDFVTEKHTDDKGRKTSLINVTHLSLTKT